jgi:mannose-6-phosphate isomerase-like protein (cupin superfamily)
MKAGKAWGLTQCLESNSVLEFHRIEVSQGGYCSKHRHVHKWNGFFVESGSLLIRVWQQDYQLVDETILGNGEYTKVAPGLTHQFEALSDVVAFEVYWTQMPEVDIVRESVGGTRPRS